MNNSLKIGLDIHGVIDTFPEKFKQLSYALAKDGAEVHIITGITRDNTIDEELAKAGIRFTHYFSIVEHLEANGDIIEWRGGLPHADRDKWNSAKSEYCEKTGIDFMFDDSPIYLESFHGIDTTYTPFSPSRIRRAVPAPVEQRHNRENINAYVKTMGIGSNLDADTITSNPA